MIFAPKKDLRTVLTPGVRKGFVPALAVVNDMELRTDKGMYKDRLDELCSGKAENEFDKWLIYY